MNSERKWWEFDSCMLHVVAMFFMLCDHVWSTLYPSMEWLTCIGRIAYPIFAFMIVEGYFHTHDFKNYIKRIFIFALISEIPFDLIYSGTIFYPYHQNVMWTFLIALCGLKLIDKIKSKGKMWYTEFAMLMVVFIWTIIGFATFVDYYGTGILTVFVFYFFRGNKWWSYLGQLLGLYWINVNLLGGYYYNITIFGMHVELIQQSLALLALIPIWLYQGKQGYHSKGFQYFCYAFYPLHMIILYMLGHIL